MGNLSSQPISYERITVESFFPSTGYKITDSYPNIKDVKQTITNVMNFLNDLINYINANFTDSTFTGNVSDTHFKHLLLFHIVKQKYISDETVQQSSSSPSNMKAVYVSESILSFKQNLMKFSEKFSEILTHYSEITNFSHDANDTPQIMQLKTQVKKKINDMIHTMMFFEFDFYVVNYVMYMYTNYCVHIFDKMNAKFIEIREYNELVRVDTKLTSQSQKTLGKKIASSESSLNNSLGDLINYLKKLQETQTVKKGGAATTTFGLPNNTLNNFENKFEYVMQLFSNKQNKYFEYRSHLDLFLKKINEKVIEHVHTIQQIYIQQAKHAITNKEIIRKLTEISDALSKKTTQINPWAINEISTLIDDEDPSLHHLSHLGREINNIISDAEKKMNI